MRQSSQGRPTSCWCTQSITINDERVKVSVCSPLWSFLLSCFQLFFPCIYFGASWFIRAVGANNAKVTGSSPGLAMCVVYAWDQAGRSSEKILFLVLIQVTDKKDQFRSVALEHCPWARSWTPPILNTKSTYPGLLNHSTSASVAHVNPSVIMCVGECKISTLSQRLLNYIYYRV